MKRRSKFRFSKPSKFLDNVTLALLLGVIVTVVMGFEAKAEPYLAVKTGLKCSTCHVNPVGGGQRNQFGNIYGANQLAAKPLDFSVAEVGKINDYLNLGGNLRYNAEFSEDDSDNKVTGFRTDSAQIYLSVTPKDSPLTFYLDQQIAPGSALNREAFALYRFSANHYVKAGKMFVPVGLRIEDDSAFIKQVTGFNFDSSDHGVELGLDFGKTLVNLFVSNGTGAVSNDDDKLLVGGRLEQIYDAFRVGSTLLHNDSESGGQTLFNLYGGWRWRELTFLSEVDWISTSAQDNEDIEQLICFFEVNYQWRQGMNIKLTSEYYDPNLDVDEDQETRYSLLTEYTPFSGLQLRTGLRVADSIPQKPQRNSQKFFVQAHVYF